MPNWTYIYLLPAAVSFFWPVVIIVRKKRVNNAQWLMCITMLMVSLGILAYMAWFRGRQQALFVYDMLFMWTAALCIPMFYMFICSLTNPHGVSLANRRLFIPPLVYCSLLLGIAFALGSNGYTGYVAETKALGCPLFEEGNTAKNMMIIFSHYGYPIFFGTGIVLIMIISTVKVHRFHTRFNKYYAEKVNHPKLSDMPLLLSSLFVFPLTVVITLVSYADPETYKYIDITLVVIVTLLQLMIGYYTFTLSYTAADLAREQRDDILRQEVNEHKKITII